MGKPQVFRSPTALIVWVVWLLFAVANGIDLAVQGRDHESVVAAAVLLLATGVVYVTAQRPRIVADDDGVTVRNPLRDHRIGWPAVTGVDLADLIRVHCEWPGPPSAGSPGAHRKIISAWAVHHSRRRQFTADAKSRRAAARPGRPPLGYRSFGAATDPAPAATEADAVKIARQLSELAAEARARTAALAASSPAPAPPTPAPPPAGTAPAAPPIRPAPAVPLAPAGAGPAAQARPPLTTWSSRGLAALVIPALILLIACLL